MPTDQTDAQAIIIAIERLTREAGAKATDPKWIEYPNGNRALYHRNADGSLAIKEPIQPEPPRAKGTITTQTVAGFALAIKDAANGSTSHRLQLCDDCDDVQIVRATINPGRQGLDDYGDYHVEFVPVSDPAWDAWFEFANRSEHTQREALEFVEDRVGDFAATLPAGAAVSTLGQLRAWLESLSLKVVREVEQGDTEVERARRDGATATGSALRSHVTLLALRVYEGGDLIALRCRWRAKLGDDGKSLVITAELVNADEAERRVWLGPVPEGATWVPLVEQIEALVGQPVIV